MAWVGIRQLIGWRGSWWLLLLILSRDRSNITSKRVLSPVLLVLYRPFTQVWPLNNLHSDIRQSLGERSTLQVFVRVMDESRDWVGGADTRYWCLLSIRPLNHVIPSFIQSQFYMTDQLLSWCGLVMIVNSDTDLKSDGNYSNWQWWILYKPLGNELAGCEFAYLRLIDSWAANTAILHCSSLSQPHPPLTEQASRSWCSRQWLLLVLEVRFWCA